MEPADSIARLGFRKWHERRLLEAFAWLFTALLAALVAALSFELLDQKNELITWMGTAGAIYVGSLIAWHGLRRFHAIFREAEHLTRQSTCTACRAFGVFEILAQSPRMSVRCLRCAHEWTFD